MAFCKYCGEEIFENIPHECERKPQQKTTPKINTNLNVNPHQIKNLLTGLVQRVGILDSKLDYYEKDMQIVPDSIALEDGEIPVKQYAHLATMQTKIKLTRAHGRLQITNKRVLFRANGSSPAGKTVCQQIFDLDKLDGIEIRKDFRFRLGDTFFAFLLSTIVMTYVGKVTDALFSADWCYPIMMVIALLTCIPVFLWKTKWLEKIMLLSIGFACLDAGAHDTTFSWFLELNFQKIFTDSSSLCSILHILYTACLFLYSFKPNLLIEFKTGSSNAIQIRHKDPIFSVKKEEYSGFAEVLPGKDADQAIREINTLINDIKTLGDLGIEKWKDK